MEIESRRTDSALIKIDKELCNNCHSCISVCPVKTCVDGAGDKIAIINDRCLGCGRCLAMCSRGARSVNDDTEAFFADLENGDPMVAMIAPAAWTMFDDVPRLIGFLKNKRVQAVFDVSFGAELASRSYLAYAKREKPKLIIAQPCAALVSFCEIYEPELLPYLAPVHSPMLHTAIMIEKFFPQYAGAKIAAVSPCAAKKTEFLETGHVHYNVTMTGLKKYIDNNHIDLSAFDASEFDGPAAERAVGFSSPGGLRSTILRDRPNLKTKIRKIEGTELVYQYLKDIPTMLKENAAPFLIDCLSCVHGCNAGPGTDNYGKPIDFLDAKIHKRIGDQKKKRKPAQVRSEIKKYWKPDLYDREYQNLSERLIGYRIPTEKDLSAIYLTMKKHTETDFLNCAACGYGSCRGMAEAIYNNLNRPENCHQYLKNYVDERLGEHLNIMENVRDGIFLIEKTKRILPSYSKALEEIFKRDKLANMPLTEVLSGFINKDAMPEIKEFLECAFDTTVTKKDMDLKNPLRSVQANFLNLDGGYDTKRLEFIFARIGSEENVEKLFVLVRDVGDQRRLRRPEESAVPETTSLEESISAADEAVIANETALSETVSVNKTPTAVDEAVAAVNKAVAAVNKAAAAVSKTATADKAIAAMNEAIASAIDETATANEAVTADKAVATDETASVSETAADVNEAATVSEAAAVADKTTATADKTATANETAAADKTTATADKTAATANEAAAAAAATETATVNEAAAGDAPDTDAMQKKQKRLVSVTIAAAEDYAPATAPAPKPAPAKPMPSPPPPSAQAALSIPLTLENGEKKIVLRFPPLQNYAADAGMQLKLYNILVMLANFSLANSIENPDVRREYGKEKNGKGEVTVSKKDGMFHFSYSDDGKGIGMEQTKKLDIVQEALKEIEAGNLSLISRKNEFFKLEWDWKI